MCTGNLSSFLLITGSNSQPTLTQPPSASVSPGNTVKLSCTVSRSMNTISWFQQKPGEAPRFVLSGTSSRGDGIPDRFTGSTSGNVGYLTITSAQAEDDADYYCSMWYSSGSVTHSDRVRRGTAPKTSLPSACVLAPTLCRVWFTAEAEENVFPCMCVQVGSGSHPSKRGEAGMWLC